MPNNLVKFTKFLTFFAVFLTVSACTVNREVNKALEKNAEKVNSVKDNVGQGGGDLRSVDTVSSKDDIWLGDKSVKILEGDPLPSRFENNDSVVLISSRNVNFLEIAEQITSLTGIPVKLDDMIVEAVREELSDTGSEEDTLTEERVTYGMPLNFSGKLSGLLNLISSRFNVWWTYKNGVIEFYEMETRVFLVYALPVSTTMNSTIGGSSSSDGESSSGETSATMTSVADTALWAQINTSIEGMIPETATLSIAPAAGSVTVTASPSTLKKVSRYIRDLNEKLSRQVAISVQVLQVSLAENESYGLDIDAVFQNSNISASATGILESAATGTGNAGFTIIDSTSKFNGSKAFIEALSTDRKVSTVTSSSVTTLNNKVAPVQVAKSVTYIDSFTSTQNGDGLAPTITVTQETVNEGFTMEILPRILDHGRVMMMVAMTLSEIVSLEKFEFSDGNFVQQPEIDTRGFVQEIAMKSGSTLILSGFEQTSNLGNNEGVGFAENPIGGTINSERDRVALVILLTPKVLISPLSPETRVSGM